MVMHPVGPLPASTYWRRRTVLLVAGLLVLLLGKACVPDSPTRRAANPKPTTTPRAVAPTVPVVPVVPKPAAAAPPACADTALTLTTTTDEAGYPLGATPKITLVVTNTSKAPCRRDLGSGAVELQVFSGADRVWSSDDCSPAKAVAVATLAPAATQAVVKTWDARRSTPGCVGSKAQAKAGTYRVVARVGTLRVEGAVFRFRS